MYDVIVPGVELAQSLRNVGYTFKTALADVVDNSISADAKTVSIVANIDEEPFIAIVDDGFGMSDGELLEAMRLAGTSPTATRRKTDLGRFGLGLKTASWSQAKRFTVVSTKNGVTSGRIFDFDKISEENSWVVEKIEDFDSIPCFEMLPVEGTLILWEKLDRLISDDSLREQEAFKEKIRDAGNYLSLVFHRFLEGEGFSKKVEITVNGNELKPRDPFCLSNKATQVGEREVISRPNGEVVIQRFVLPHKDKFSNPREFERAGGEEGFIKNQGFYVYRAKRLVQYGTWFGLARQGELTKLSRVRIDIPNSMDEEWKIDVAKSSVQPPNYIRKRLREIVGQFINPAKRVYTHRGIQQTEESFFPVWNREITRDRVRYRINQEHPYIQAALKNFSPAQQQDIFELFGFIASGFPTDALWSDFGDDESKIENASLSRETLEKALSMIPGLKSSENERLLNNLIKVEPFRSNKEIVKEIISAWRKNAEL